MSIKKYISKTLKKIEAKNWYFFAAVLFRLSLEFSYINFVSPVFAYSGMFFDFNWMKYLESWFLFVCILIFSSPKLFKPSDYLINFLNFSFVAPLLVYYSFANSDRLHLYLVFLSLALIFYFRKGLLFKMPFYEKGEKFVYAIVGVGCIVVSVWMVYSGGLSFFNLDFSKVYDFRGAVSDVINAGPMGYLNIWATKVFGPVLLAIALWRSKYLIAIIVFALHIFWFAVSSHKSVLFYPFLVTFLWAWFRNTKALALIPLSMSFVVILSTAVYMYWEEVLLGSLFVRRVFFVPAQLTFVYFDFFSKYEFVYWSNSIFSEFIKYPYDRNTALLIGDYMGTEAAANNSFLSTGYMHAGICGVIFYGVLVGLLFRLIDSLARDGIPPWVAVACVIVPSQALLTSSDLPTALLTHGMLVSLIILFLMRKPEKNNQTLYVYYPGQTHYGVQNIPPHLRPPTR